MKIGLVGGSNQEYSLPLDSQRSINCYVAASPQGKESAALYGTPGLSLFATAGAGAVRGGFTAANDRCFFVSGANLYEIESDGAATSRGTLNTSSGIVSIAENGTQLAICDGEDVYIFTYSSNVFAVVSDGDLPSSGTVTFIDGYFVVTENDTGKFYISALYDGTSWDALDFASAESSPDDLLRAVNAVGQLWLFGSKTGEIWTNTGASAFPFERISGAKMEVGILAPHSAVAVDNSIFWIGRDDIGKGIVYRANGFTPQRVSTSPIELLIQEASDPDNLRAYTYQASGHVFYVITGGGLSTSLVYDISTQIWHERAYLSPLGAFEQHLGACGTFAFGKQLVGSRNDGKIYEMSSSYYSDDGSELALERIFTHLSAENVRTVLHSLEIAMESGVGLTSGQGSDPEITLWISRDGGRTYSNGYTTSFGKIGKYGTRAVWRRLGLAGNVTFKVRITDPVKRVLIGAYLQ